MLRPALIFLIPVLCMSAPPSRVAEAPVGADLAMAAVAGETAAPADLADTRAAGWTWAKANDVADLDACHGHGRAFAAGCSAFVAAQASARDAQLAANFR